MKFQKKLLNMLKFNNKNPVLGQKAVKKIVNEKRSGIPRSTYMFMEWSYTSVLKYICTCGLDVLYRHLV